MAETHDLFFRVQFFHQPAFRVIRRPDFFKHLHCFFVGAAVQGTLQRRNCGSDRCVDSCERRSRDARRKGGSVEFVVGVKIENRIQHPDLPVLQNVAIQFVKEIAGLREIGSFRQRLLAVRDAPAVSD